MGLDNLRAFDVGNGAARGRFVMFGNQSSIPRTRADRMVVIDVEKKSIERTIDLTSLPAGNATFRALSTGEGDLYGLTEFRAGAGKAGVRQSEAQRDAALATYEKAIQTAFREVSDALARRGTIDAQTAAQRALTAAATDNYRLSDARYRGGIDTFLQSLDAQRSLYAAQRSLIATELVAASNRVTLYRVLGGDATLDMTASGPRPVSGTTPR